MVDLDDKFLVNFDGESLRDKLITMVSDEIPSLRKRKAPTEPRSPHAPSSTSPPIKPAKKKKKTNVSDGQLLLEYNQGRPDIFPADLQRLLLHIAGRGPAPANKFFVRNAERVRQVVVVSIPGISKSMNTGIPPMMQGAERLLGEPINIMVNKSTCNLNNNYAMDSLHNVTSNLKVSSGYRKIDLEKQTGSDLYSSICLSREQLIDHGFTLPGDDIHHGYVTAPSKLTQRGRQEVGRFHKIVAMDCEMVLTSKGHELARCTLVDENRKVIMDHYVRPAGPVLDYLTRFSGITASLLDKKKPRNFFH